MFSIDLFNVKDGNINKVKQYINSLTSDYVMNCDFDELVDYIFGEYKIEEIIIDKKVYYEWIEPKYGGKTYTLKCKYEIISGIKSLEYRPNPFSYSLGGDDWIPIVEKDYSSSKSYLVFKRNIDLDEIEKINENNNLNDDYFSKKFASVTNLFFQNANRLTDEIISANKVIKEKIISELTNFYSLANRKISLRNALKISTMPISDIRNKKVELKMIKKNDKMPLANVNEPYYFISNEDYDLIIQIINRCMIQYERTSETFKDLGEEDIRNIILGAVNANFNFSGSAESFSNKGHTDIMIEAENKAAFIAECKLWKGKQYVSAGIDQLLNYATYKDGKLALLIFNKDNRNYDKVILELNNLIEEHPRKISLINHKENVWQYKFHSITNESAFIITFIVANYYSN